MGERRVERHETPSDTPDVALAREGAATSPGGAGKLALIDRVIHHADIIAVEGQSYRLRQAEDESRAKSKEVTPPTPKKR